MPKKAPKTQAKKAKGQKKSVQLLQPGKWGDMKPNLALYRPLTQYKFVRHGTPTTITQTITTDLVGSLQFTLDATSGYTELTALFDSYRIECVEVEFVPMYNMQSITLAGTVKVAELYTAIDYDDNNAAASLGAMNEYRTNRIATWNQRFTRSFKPRAAAAVYGSGAFTSYAQVPGNQWMDCASPSVAHYGLKYGITYANTAQTTQLQSWTVRFVYYLDFRYAR